jgi:phytoene dehydrogenase-like protein
VGVEGRGGGGSEVDTGQERRGVLPQPDEQVAGLQALRLSEHGLKLAAESLPTVALAENAQHLHLGSDDLSGLAQTSPADAAALLAWRALLQRFARALHPLLTQTPPRLGTDAWHDRAALLGLGWRIRRLGRKDMRELLRIGGMNVFDLLEEQFDSDALKGALGFDAVLGTNFGPRSPGTTCRTGCSAARRMALASGPEPLDRNRLPAPLVFRGHLELGVAPDY